MTINCSRSVMLQTPPQPCYHTRLVFLLIYEYCIISPCVFLLITKSSNFFLIVIWPAVCLASIWLSFTVCCLEYLNNIQNYSEYRVTHASGQLNRTSDACNCGHGSSPPTSRNGNELSGDNILWSRLIASGPSERRQHERRQLRSKRRQREFIPSRLENVVKELVRSLWVCSVCNNQQCRIVFKCLPDWKLILF